MDYQYWLDEEFKVRTKRNTQYSVRAFSRDLGLSPGFTSQVLSRKRHLSELTAHQVLSKLNWSSKRKQAFLGSVRLENAKRGGAHFSAIQDLQKEILKYLGSDPNYRELNDDVFAAVSEWQHFATMELSKVQGFRNDIPWIANRLNIPRNLARAVTKRLLRLGLLKRVGSSLVCTMENYLVTSPPGEAIRKYHRALIQLAEKAVDQQSSDVRHLSGATLAFDISNLERVREILDSARDQIIALGTRGSEKSVYQVSMQFFRLDNEKDD